MAFSALALGVAIPQLLIKLTDINEAKRKNKMGEQQPAQQPGVRLRVLCADGGSDL